jgi:hypothetical protein
MTRPHHNPHSDANQPQNHRDLRKLGLVVIDVSKLPGKQVGDDTDTLDAFVGDPVSGCWLQVEWKVPGGKLTERQRRYVERYDVYLHVLVAETVEDVVRWFGRER